MFCLISLSSLLSPGWWCKHFFFLWIRVWWYTCTQHCYHWYGVSSREWLACFGDQFSPLCTRDVLSCRFAHDDLILFSSALLELAIEIQGVIHRHKLWSYGEEEKRDGEQLRRDSGGVVERRVCWRAVKKGCDDCFLMRPIWNEISVRTCAHMSALIDLDAYHERDSYAVFRIDITECRDQRLLESIQ